MNLNLNLNLSDTPQVGRLSAADFRQRSLPESGKMTSPLLTMSTGERSPPQNNYVTDKVHLKHSSAANFRQKILPEFAKKNASADEFIRLGRRPLRTKFATVVIRDELFRRLAYEVREFQDNFFTRRGH